MERDMKERRKIQFSVPSAVPTQLDPKQVEMIRRRRPTPATLFRMTDHPSPEEENPGHQLAVCENGLLMGKRLNTAVYQPPSLTAVQKMVEAHLQSSKTSKDSPSAETSDNEEASPDSDKDDSRSDQLDHQPGHEVIDEERVSTIIHDAPGGDEEGDLKDGIHKKAEIKDDADVALVQVGTVSVMVHSDHSCSESSKNKDLPPNSSTDLPADTRSDQSERHSTSELTDKGMVPILLNDGPWEDDKEAAETEGVDKCTDKGEGMEKGED